MNQLQHKLHLLNECNMMEEDDDHKSYNQYYRKNLMDHQYHSMQTKQGINVFLKFEFLKSIKASQ